MVDLDKEYSPNSNYNDVIVAVETDAEEEEESPT
jgi:hypothetical protein